MQSAAIVGTGAPCVAATSQQHLCRSKLVTQLRGRPSVAGQRRTLLLRPQALGQGAAAGGGGRWVWQRKTQTAPYASRPPSLRDPCPLRGGRILLWAQLPAAWEASSHPRRCSYSPSPSCHMQRQTPPQWPALGRASRPSCALRSSSSSPRTKSVSVQGVGLEEDNGRAGGDGVGAGVAAGVWLLWLRAGFVACCALLSTPPPCHAPHTPSPPVAFIKGTKQFPQCGFSNTVVQILNSTGGPWQAVHSTVQQYNTLHSALGVHFYTRCGTGQARPAPSAACAARVQPPPPPLLTPRCGPRSPPRPGVPYVTVNVLEDDLLRGGERLSLLLAVSPRRCRLLSLLACCWRCRWLCCKPCRGDGLHAPPAFVA